MTLPSLEKRLFHRLRYRRVIGAAKCFAWLREAVRLVPRGIRQILYGNKMYLRGVRAEEVNRTGEDDFAAGSTAAELCAWHLPGIERVLWHAERGHAIVIVSGTLEPLAQRAALALEADLAKRGISATIGVYATRLEMRDRRFTGRIVGEAMFGEAKARAVKQIAASRGFDLERCFAYGDSANDRWMLEAVGRPSAVNPSNDLARIAKRNGWPVLHWNRCDESTRRTQRAQMAQSSRRRKATEISAHEMETARTKSGF